MRDRIKRTILGAAAGFLLMLPLSVRAFAEDLNILTDAPVPSSQDDVCSPEEDAVPEANQSVPDSAPEADDNLTESAESIGQTAPVAGSSEETETQPEEAQDAVLFSLAELPSNSQSCENEGQAPENPEEIEESELCLMMALSASEESPEIQADASAAAADEQSSEGEGQASENPEEIEESGLCLMTTLSASEESPETQAAASAATTVGGTTLSSTADSSGWNGTSGWRYDGQNISMVNNTSAVEIHAENQGIDLFTAGLNHISTLYSDGDVNITGTGILLIDNIDMLEGSNLNLRTNTDLYTDGSGSTAVFLKSETDGKYYLINGSIAGILDEEYTLPSGIELVIPEGGSLNMNVTDCVKEETRDPDNNVIQSTCVYGVSENANERYNENTVNADGTTTTKKLEITFPKLTISEGSSLTVQQNSSVVMDTTGYTAALYSFLSDFTRITVRGVLNLFGSIIGTNDTPLIPEIVVEENGSVQGTGKMYDVDIRYNNVAATDDTINAGDNCRLIVDHAGPSVNANGDLKIIYSDGAVIGKITVESADAAVTLNPRNELESLNLTAAPVGSIHAPDAQLYLNGTYYGVDVQAALDAVAQRQAAQSWVYTVASVSYHGVHCAFPDIREDSYHGGKYQYTSASVTANPDLSFDASGVESICYDVLKAMNPDTNGIYVYRVCYVQNGTVKSAVLKSGDSLSIPRSDIFRIEQLDIRLAHSVDPAIGSISSSTGNTGAGILGGANGGTLTGGSYTSVLPGHRTNAPATPAAPVTPDTPDTPEKSGEKDDMQNNGFYLDVRVSGSRTHFDLRAYLDGRRLQTLNGGSVPVSFRTELPDSWNKQDLFAIFRNPDGSFTTVRIRYDAVSGCFVFDAPVLGEFDIVCIHWDGNDLDSPAFRAAIAAALEHRS